MKQGLLLQWSPCTPQYLSSSFPSSSLPFPPKLKPLTLISATLNSSSVEQDEQQNLPARERRKLRNERREKNAFNWKEEVEMKLIKKPKKRYASWTEELNLDNLADLGPQWWAVRVTRVNYEYNSERLARALANNYPEMEFKMYIPAVQEKRKLKNGSLSVKSKPLFPGNIFLRCVLNKELHDFIRECDGIGGFVGSKVGNTKRQINRPRPVAEEDMEAIFKQAKEEQEKADQAFLEEHKGLLDVVTSNLDFETINLETQNEAKPKRQTRKTSRTNKVPKIGSTVKVVAGAFADFSGILKKLDKKNGRATVAFTLFGKETIADVDIKDVVELVD